MANSNGVSRLTREPQPMPAGGDGAPPQGAPADRAIDYLVAGTQPRTVTAEIAYRCRLWERGRLILEDAFGAHRVTQIFGDYSALLEDSDPELEPEARDLIRVQTLTFVPSGGDQSE